MKVLNLTEQLLKIIKIFICIILVCFLQNVANAQEKTRRATELYNEATALNAKSSRLADEVIKLSKESKELAAQASELPDGSQRKAKLDESSAIEEKARKVAKEMESVSCDAHRHTASGYRLQLEEPANLKPERIEVLKKWLHETETKLKACPQ